MAVFVPLAFLLLFPYIISSAAAAANNPEKAHVIKLNERIQASMEPTAWYSPSHRFAFGFLPAEGGGFLVGIWIVGDGQNMMVWTANRDGPPVSSNATVELTEDGLVLTADTNGQKLIADAQESAASASMYDSGNLVLYGQSSNAAVWESWNFPTDTILGGQKLAAGSELYSTTSPTNFSTGRFRLKMEFDGNLVAYPTHTSDSSVDAYWASGTNEYSSRQYNFQEPYHYLYLDKAGRLKLEDRYNSSVFLQLNGNYSGDAATTVYRATLDPNGNFGVYSNTSKDALWTALNDTCDVKSFCGFNSYCTMNDYMPSCYCVPGTMNIQGKLRDGCQRNFTKQKCRDGKAELFSYDITPMQKMKWEDNPYFMGLMSEEDCKRSCLEDCDCDAAEYAFKKCSKHTFPLRYVSRDTATNSTTFFKIGKRSSNGSGTTSLWPAVVVIKKTNWMLILALALGLVACSCAALALLGVFAFKIRVFEYKKLLEAGTSGIAKELTLRLYSYKELKMLTKGFKEELGKGSFGAVYKGMINNGEKVIAVKRLQKLVEEGEREFQSEMRVIGKTHHKNLVRLLGYCIEGTNRLLVYEYMSNGSLADILFHSKRRLHWHERVRVALDVARGILYLHEECEAPIIHCDIKPQNILMDEFWNAKISDFGLAKLLMPDQTRTITDARGTRGYLAPEWHKNLPISLKVDVYSYGIVLLEIICCRRSIDLSVARPEEIQLSGWAYNCFAAGELGKLVGDEEVEDRSLERMVAVALWCIQADPILRPSMKGVVLMLQGITSISTPPCPAV